MKGARSWHWSHAGRQRWQSPNREDMSMERAVTDDAGSPVAQLRFGRALSAEDPLSLFSALLTKARTIWMQRTYPFAGFGRDVSIHYSCDIRRSAASRIRIGSSV